MLGGTIEHWEQTQAELEIRRWLASIGLWAPGAERTVWQASDETAAPRALTAEEIDQVLRDEVIGRLGCHADGKTYVVPVAYIYDGQALYGHTSDGLKLRMLRANPEVCVEVDQIESVSNWRSVIAWGWFEELHGAEAAQALHSLAERIRPLLSDDMADFTHAAAQFKALDEVRTVVYQIKLGKCTGRCFSAAA
jgi:nitroimidazol reductase NimA-like FMN-containing flavoprotein (pyridoxamine 5'-phosphate oxidase superfamily)